MAKYRIGFCTLFLLLLVQPALAQESGSRFEVISIENADQLQQIDQLGYGWLHKSLWHPDGQRLFVAGSNALVVYSVDDWSLPRVIRVPHPPLVNIIFSADGLLIALDQEKYITIIDNHTYEPLYTLEARTRLVDLGSVMQFTESYFIALVAVDLYDIALAVWDVANGELIAKIPYSAQSDAMGAKKIDWPLDDEDIARFLENPGDHLSPPAYEEKLIEVDGIQRKPFRTILSPDGQYILYQFCPNDEYDPETCAVSQVLIQERKTRRTLRRFEFEANYPYMGFVGNDVDHLGSIVCSAKDENSYCQKWQIDIISTLSGEVLGTLPGYFINPPVLIQNPAPATDYYHESQYITAADSTRVLVWDASTYAPVAQLSGFHGPPIDIAFSLDGQRIAAASKSKDGGSAITLWQRSETGFAPAGGIPCGGTVDLLPSSDLLICGGASNEYWGIRAPMELWKVGDEPVIIQEYEDDLVTDVAFSSDGEWLAVAHNVVIDLRHTGSGEIQTTISAITFYSHMRFSRDMRYAFVYINGTQPYLYPWSDIVKSTTFTPGEGSLFRLSNELDWRDLSASVFSSDVQRLAVSVFRQSIQIYDVNSGQLLHSLPIDGAATELAFSPDNELLAATICHIKNIEQTLSCLFQLIGVESGIVLYTSPMFEEAIYDLAFDPDGTFLATAHGRIEVHYDDGRSKENAVRLWGIPFTE